MKKVSGIRKARIQIKKNIDVNRVEKIKLSKGVLKVDLDDRIITSKNRLIPSLLRREITLKRGAEFKKFNREFLNSRKKFIGGRLNKKGRIIASYIRNDKLETINIKKSKNLLFNDFESDMKKQYKKSFKDLKKEGKRYQFFSTPSYDLRRELSKELLKLPFGRKRYVLTFEGGRSLTLNNDNMNVLRKSLGEGREFAIGVKREFLDSNEEIEMMLSDINSVEIQTIEGDKRKNKKRENNFFPYRVNKEYYKVEWSRYGLYNELKKNENCVVQTLRESGKLSSKAIESLKFYCKDRYIPQTKLKKFAEDNNLKIKIIDYGDGGYKKGRYENYEGKKKELLINKECKGKNEIICASICKHLFIVDHKTGITKFYIDNEEELKNALRIRLEKWQKKPTSKRLKKEYCNMKENITRIYKREKGKDGVYKYKYTNTKFMRSDYLIRHLVKNNKKYLTPLSLSDVDVLKSYYTDKIKEIKSLDYLKSDVVDVKAKEFKKCKNESCEICHCDGSNDSCQSNKYKTHVFFDFESKTFNEAKKHEVYLGCSVTHVKNKKYDFTKKKAFLSDNPGKEFLDSLRSNSLCIAHNLGYDFQFIMPYLSDIKIIRKNNSIMSCSAKYGPEPNEGEKDTRKRLYFKDSQKIIDTKLGDFGSWFNLEQPKEVMPYKFYNNGNFEIKHTYKELLKYFKNEDDKRRFINNCKKWDCVFEEDGILYFDKIKYSKRYCMIDCEVLMKGYEKFNIWIKDLCQKTYKVRDVEYKKYLKKQLNDGLIDENEMNEKIESLRYDNIDISDFISIPSIVNELLIRCKCYEDVKKLSGVPRMFIQKSVVGGKVMTRQNKKWHVKQRLNDFDAVSCYPSACVRMIGFLKGAPKILESFDYNSVKKNDGYFVEVEILNIPKKRAFPLLSYKDKNGIRTFTNEASNINKIVMDNILLEDCIKFHNMKPDVDFKIIRGYYFDEGFNPMIKSTVQSLFEARLEKKKKKCGSQIVFKLLLNSLYGKTIMKPVETDFEIKDSEEAYINSLIKNYNNIKYGKRISEDKYMIKKMKTVDTHYSLPHVGSQILSMSKRLMNEVMCLAEDLGTKIYYTDTDSMHIEDDKIENLSKEFKKMYNRDLIGKKLGQFHRDFDFKKCNFDKKKGIVSVESYFLGKKVYIDKCELFDLEGKAFYKYHVRVKGIPKYALGKNNNEIWNMYKDLANGWDFCIDIKACSNVIEKPLFTYGDDFCYYDKLEFTRSMSYPGKLIYVK